MTLIDRLSKLEGPDREVDRQIHAYFGLPFSEVLSDKPFPYNAYTASVDAAIALAERVLPGCKYKVSSIGDGLAEVWTNKTWQEAEGRTPAIALCIALLRAKEASKP